MVNALYETYRCGRCQKDLPVSNFTPSQVLKRGSWCRNCNNEYRRSRRGASAPPRATDECLWCGADIRNLRSNARYCSASCGARTWRRDNPGRHRALRLKCVYGITIKEFDELLESQGGVCAICQSDDPASANWHVDHCHSSDAVRGILCGPCNQGLGNFRDNQAALLAAIDYLARQGIN